MKEKYGQESRLTIVIIVIIIILYSDLTTDRIPYPHSATMSATVPHCKLHIEKNMVDGIIISHMINTESIVLKVYSLILAS